MHPEVIKNEPGNCPGCGMALIPSVAKAMEGKPKETGKKPDGHDVSELSHKNHEAAMTNPQMAKKNGARHAPTVLDFIFSLNPYFSLLAGWCECI